MKCCSETHGQSTASQEKARQMRVFPDSTVVHNYFSVELLYNVEGQVQNEKNILLTTLDGLHDFYFMYVWVLL